MQGNLSSQGPQPNSEDMGIFVGHCSVYHILRLMFKLKIVTHQWLTESPKWFGFAEEVLQTWKKNKKCGFESDLLWFVMQVEVI